MKNGEEFFSRYHDLQRRMELRAKADGCVLVPNPEPTARVDYVFVCMEPSLARWAPTPEDAQEKLTAGFQNFLYSMEDFILHFSIRRYLCGPKERYHVTDLSKGAMLTDDAAANRERRYDRWYPLFLEELQLVGKPTAKVVAVGKVVHRYLDARANELGHPLSEIMHYSGQAAVARARVVKGNERRFKHFLGSVTLDSLLETAKEVLLESRTPDRFRRETMSRLRNGQLSTSRQQLIFSYMLAFESLKGDADAR